MPACFNIDVKEYSFSLKETGCLGEKRIRIFKKVGLLKPILAEDKDVLFRLSMLKSASPPGPRPTEALSRIGVVHLESCKKHVIGNKAPAITMSQPHSAATPGDNAAG